MPGQLNLFPARVPIGRTTTADGRTVDVLMTPEFSRALADLFVRVGGVDSVGLNELAAMVASDAAQTQIVALQRQIEAFQIVLGMLEDPSATIRYILTRYSPLQSPKLTGTPTTPTAAADTNTTQVATCEFVLGQASSTVPVVDSGTGSVGSSTRYARADHVHPSDGTKQDKISIGTVTGSRGGNAALASLLTVLATQGLINNSTTA